MTKHNIILNVMEKYFQMKKTGLSLEECSKKLGIPIESLEYFDEIKETSKEIKDLILNGNYEEATILCMKYPDVPVIQSQYITILIKRRSFGLALSVGNNFKDNYYIQGQLIKCYCSLKEFDKATSIVEKNLKNDSALRSLLSGYRDELNACRKRIKVKLNGKDKKDYEEIYVRSTDLEASLKTCYKKPYSEIKNILHSIKGLIEEFYEKEKENGR